MDDEIEYEQEPTGAPVGTQLKEAREAKGISLEDMAAKTRIPKRHIESLEANDWEKLPAATYAAGFAKTHAAMSGVDPAWASQAVREEMGAYTPEYQPSPVYEINEEKRGIPAWLIVVAILAVIAAILGFSYLNDQRLAADETPQEEEQEEVAEATPAATPDPATPDVDSDTPVTLVATRAVWLRITDGDEVLFARELAEGEEYQVPATANAPLMETARPASLQARFEDETVGFPGEDGTRISGVSLLAPDLVGNRSL
ncbi:RodZ domain-containing protein [Sphingomicrobium sp. XHP0239]|uniref:helix-turn-helix domain-containing protein n=1 Tax=Sphingomicrobium maritimum TaxID=3133972 RepID=UPI0031CC86D7